MDQARMAGELSFLTIHEVVVAVEGVEAALVVLIWSATSVVSLVILPVNVDCVVVQEDDVAAVLDIVGAQVMDEGDFTQSDVVLYFRLSISVIWYHTFLALSSLSSYCCSGSQLLSLYLHIVFFSDSF